MNRPESPLASPPGGRRARRLAAWLALPLVCFACLAPGEACASRYTPAVWRRLIPEFPKSAFAGQRKHVGWSRDRDGNFIDDKMPVGAETVRVVLELNDCYPLDHLRSRLAPFGRIDYVGQLVSCVYMSAVRPAKLDSLARLSEVAMVVWSAPFYPSMGVSVAGVQAAPSSAYGTNYVRSNVGGKWLDPSGGAATTGSGVNIAIVDTGVRNGHPSLPGSDATSSGPVAGGYDATTSSNPMEDGTDPDPWDPLLAHGTRVASIALGRGKAGVDCGKDPSEPSAPDCAGVAPEAGLVDVQVVAAKVGGTDTKVLFADGGDFMRGLDWIGNHNDKGIARITVMNISLSDGIDCDGNCPACQAVEKLASEGVTPVVGLGNRNDDDIADAIRRVPSPAAASSAITVGGSDDLRSVIRVGDATFTGHLIGPRFVGGVPDPDATGEKPDFVAPSRNIVSLSIPGIPGAPRDSDFYDSDSGTSYAAPLAAGAAALLIQTDPTLDPATIKDILRKTADHSIVTSGAAGWDATFGMGTLNIYDAVNLARKTDLRFESCVDAGSTVGSPCALSGLPSWLNTIDLTTDPDPPRNGETCTIKAAVHNAGPVDARNFLVAFGYYEFGTGTTLFHPIETKLVDFLAAGASTQVPCEWTPSTEGHQCIQASLIFGPDPNLVNNLTQRNLVVDASTYDVSIQNPYVEPARFYLRAESDTQNWPCTVDQTDFMIGGPEDCPVHVRVEFRAPRDAPIGAHADCNVSVFARRTGAQDSTLIGGVTVRTLVPDTCRVTGQVLGTDLRPLRYVKLTFERDVPPVLLRAPWEENRTVTTDEKGRFGVSLPAGAHKRLRIRASGLPEWAIPFESRCGAPPLRIEVGKEGAQLLSTGVKE